MYKFLLQVENNGHYSEDTATIARLIDERNWLCPNDEPMTTQDCRFEDLTSEIVANAIPVGSVEFVNKALGIGYNLGPMKPINIPQPLFRAEYLGRKCRIVNSVADIRRTFFDWHTSKLFIKSNTKIKAGYTDLYSARDNFPEDTEYFISAPVNLISEWRCFVYRGVLKGIKNYCGDPWLFPDRNFVTDCINQIGDSLTAYTLDVGVTSNGKTIVIEVHNFISCGLYGFDDSSIIPMLINAFKQEIQKETKHCSDCEYFLGMGDWNLCCSKKYDLCYANTPACELFSCKN